MTYFIHMEREELEMSNLKFSNHHAIDVGAKSLFRCIVVCAKFVSSYLIDITVY